MYHAVLHVRLFLSSCLRPSSFPMSCIPPASRIVRERVSTALFSVWEHEHTRCCCCGSSPRLHKASGWGSALLLLLFSKDGRRRRFDPFDSRQRCSKTRIIRTKEALTRRNETVSRRLRCSPCILYFCHFCVTSCVRDGISRYCCTAVSLYVPDTRQCLARPHALASRMPGTRVYE